MDRNVQRTLHQRRCGLKPRAQSTQAVEFFIVSRPYATSTQDSPAMLEYQGISFLTRELTVRLHRHSAVQVVFTLDEPFDTTIDGQVWSGVFGFVADSDCPHECAGPTSQLVIVNIAPSSQLARTLRVRQLRGHRMLRVDALARDAIREAVVHPNPLNPGAELVQQANARSRRLLASLAGGSAEAAPPLDMRIATALAFIRHHLCEPASTAALADAAHLSQSRFTSLFRAQVGIPVSRFYQWARLMTATSQLLSGSNLSMTVIALDAGFYDLPHMHRVMRAMLGMPPEQLLQHSHLIQALDGWTL
jgi:AraC-like DNA-binding protein